MDKNSDERLRYPWYYDLKRNHFFEDDVEEAPVVFDTPQQFQMLGEIMAEKLNERICKDVRKHLQEKSGVATIRGDDTTLWCQLKDLIAESKEELLAPYLEREIAPLIEPLSPEEKALLWILEDDFYKKGPESDDMELRIRQMILSEVQRMAYGEYMEEETNINVRLDDFVEQVDALLEDIREKLDARSGDRAFLEEKESWLREARTDLLNLKRKVHLGEEQPDEDTFRTVQENLNHLKKRVGMDA